MVRMVFVAAMVTAAVSLFSGCTEADRVSVQIAREADDFNVYRKIVIINTRTDKIELEIVGKMSITISNGRIDVLIEEDGRYFKHIINLTENNMYVIEDLGSANTSQYKYEINYAPENVVPHSVLTNREEVEK